MDTAYGKYLTELHTTTAEETFRHIACSIINTNLLGELVKDQTLIRQVYYDDKAAVEERLDVYMKNVYINDIPNEPKYVVTKVDIISDEVVRKDIHLRIEMEIDVPEQEAVQVIANTVINSYVSQNISVNHGNVHIAKKV